MKDLNYFETKVISAVKDLIKTNKSKKTVFLGNRNGRYVIKMFLDNGKLSFETGDYEDYEFEPLETYYDIPKSDIDKIKSIVSNLLSYWYHRIYL